MVPAHIYEGGEVPSRKDDVDLQSRAALQGALDQLVHPMEWNRGQQPGAMDGHTPKRGIFSTPAAEPVLP